MNCKYCTARGQTWSGAAPECAFTAEKFNTDNWNCATLNHLRDLAETVGKRWRLDDTSFGVVPAYDADGEHAGYIALSWYKERGRTDQAYLFNGSDAPTPLTYQEAAAAIEHYAWPFASS